MRAVAKYCTFYNAIMDILNNEDICKNCPLHPSSLEDLSYEKDDEDINENEEPSIWVF